MKEKKIITLVIIILAVSLISVYIGFFIYSMDDKDKENEIEKPGTETIYTNKKTEESDSLIISKETLHESNKEFPDENTVLVVQKNVLEGLNKQEIKEIKETINRIHLYFEIQFIEMNISTTLSDPESPIWVIWEKTGTIDGDDIPGSDPVFNEYDGDSFIKDLELIKRLVDGDKLKADISVTQKLISFAVKNHDLSALYYAHQMLHDIDYWVINYPIEYPIAAPPSWKGVHTYFGVVASLGNNYPLEIIKLLLE
ncbi:MAG: hypothetical protein ACOWWH_08965 [Eubacteriaceae bacterium]